MNSKRILSLLLCVLLVGSFTACRKNPKSGGDGSDYDSDYSSNWYDDESGDTTGSEKGDSETESGKNNSSKGTGGKKNNAITAEAESNTNLSGFPIVKKKESIKIMAITRASDIGDTNKSQFTQVYSEMTNMDIKFDLVTESTVSQRKTLALQSGNLPDVFARGCNISDQDVQQYSAEGTFVEITKDMLKKWAPNIYKFYDDYKLWNLVKTTDGKMYSLAGGTRDFNYDQHYLWINKTWLKKLGLSMPKTMDEFYEVLKAFKTKDPNGNASNDEIPYATWASSGFFTHPWGVIPGIMVNSKGKVVYGNATDNMKKCATFWNKVYKEGLVDKNTIDNWAGDNAAFKTLIKSGKVGCFYWGWPQGPLGDELKNYEICPWPTSGENNGDLYPVYTQVQNNFYPDAFFITKACKNVPAALRFLDYLYTNDGYMLGLYGKPGYLYTKVNDTTYKATGKKQTANDILGPRWTMTGRYFLDGATYQIETNLETQLRAVADKTMEGRVKQYNQKTMPNNFKSKQEVKAINQYSTYFNSMNSTYLEYVKGNKSLSSDWTQMVNELNKKGLNKYIAAWQNYYDRVSK